MNKEQTRTRIGQRVKALRLLADLSQDELAQRAGLQRTHIGRIEGDLQYSYETRNIK